MDDWQEQLGKAIYGGPSLPVKQIKKLWQQHNLSSPCYVLTVHVPKQEDIQNLRNLLKKKIDQQKTSYKNKIGLWALNLHGNLVYVSFSGCKKPVEHTISKTNLTAGLAQKCTGEKNWVSAIQKAIVNLLKLELEQIDVKKVSTSGLDFIKEQQAAALALQAIHSDENSWEQALDVWIKIVLLRHSQQINEVRRHQVEFIAQLTGDIDHNVGLSYPFYQAINTVYQTFAFSKIPGTINGIVSDIRPHLSKSPDPMATSPSARLVNSAMQYLNARVTEPFALETLAKTLHVSPNHLARVFKKHTGQTIVQYLHSLRVGQAKKKLRQTDDTIFSVALDSGFESAEHFHRIFKRLTKTTPARYRKDR